MSKVHTDSTSAAQHKTQGKRKADRWKVDCERRRGTSAAQHKTQGKRKADRWKIDCERRREEHKTLLNAHQLIPSTVL